MTIEIDGRSIISDEKGVVSTFIPLEYQKKAYPIKAGYSLEIDTLFMPCGKDDILIVKLSLWRYSAIVPVDWKNDGMAGR